MKSVSKRHSAIIFSTIVAIWVALDQVTKVWVRQVVALDGPFTAIPGLFNFTFVKNEGAAFSIFSGARWYLCLMAIFAVAVIIWYLFFRKENPSIIETVALSFAAAGAVGNAIDRLVFGYVTDFIETTFMNFAIFNVADIGVTCGVVIFIIYLFIPQSSHDSVNQQGEKNE